MAMGADRSIHVLVEDKGEAANEGELEPLGVAKLLKEVAQKENSNLVILGKQSIDGDNGQTGQMLAGLLGWGQATQASKIDFLPTDGESGVTKVEVTCEVDGGVETLRGQLPMVITTDLRLNEPRYASLPNIMKAKKKPLEKKTLADYGVDSGRRLKTWRVEGEFISHISVSFTGDCSICLRSSSEYSSCKAKIIAEPPPRQGGGKVADVDGMIAKLKELGAI